ncbi:hypothetical protein QN277_000262 [Acacia crassicarpa]|uniref:Response regulatory domain-containing protein n=1 Tax=Acacia crassicarpa TaxID=499986 RepID=A0AAE1N5X3_9FABA|nr:hypothetical protein QN277_000262 [Acacia crassicarpa]
MNLSNNVKGSMSTTSSSSALKSGGDCASAVDQFPAGLLVLVVDNDPTCLMVLEKMLRTCLYEAKCERAEVALSLLRENKNGFDIVISDVHMPDMDGLLVDENGRKSSLRLWRINELMHRDWCVRLDSQLYQGKKNHR